MANGGRGGYGRSEAGGNGGASNQNGYASYRRDSAGGKAGSPPGGNGTNGNSPSRYYAGGGGGGGADGTVAAPQGGNGGNGGNAVVFFYSNGGGGGGGGGAGIGSLASNFSNSGTVAGGLGGAGGNGAYGTSYRGFTKGNGGGGGGGGYGITTTALGLTITNQAGAYITGGNGGAGGAGSVGAPTQNGQAGAAGAGGAGIVGAGLTVINSGTITGGTSGDGTTQADAITFTGGTNNLTITSTSAISGRVLAHSTADTLGLGGDTDATFDLSQLGNIGSAAQYQRFGILDKSGASTWTLSNAPTSSSPLAYEVDAGTLDLGGTTQTIAGLTLTGGTLSDGEVDTTGTFAVEAGTVSAVLGGSGAVDKTTTGTVTLSAANTYTGGTTIEDGTLAVSGDANLGDASGGLAFTGGTLDMTTGFTTARNVTLAGTGTVEVDSGAGEIDGVISDGAAAGALDKTGTGTLTLAGANTYTGGTTIEDGTLAVSADTNLGDASGGLAFTGGTLDMTTGFTTGRDVSMTGTGTIEVDTGAGEIDGVISDGATAGALDKTGAGTLTLTGTNTYTDGTTLAGGTLAVSADANLGAASGGLTFTGGTLDMTTGFTTARDVTIAGTGTVEVDSGTGEIDGVISDGATTGTLEKTGAGTLTLGGANTYSGGTTIAAGTLAVSADANLGDTSGRITFTGGTLDMTTGFTTGRDVSITGTGTIEVDSGTGEIDGVISDSTPFSALLKTGAGTLTLSGANTYTGGTTIAAGTLAVSNDVNLGDASGWIVFTGGTLDMTTGFTTGRDVSITGTGTIEVDRGTGEIDGFIFDGANVGVLDKTGAGTLTLTAANIYSGGTTIAEGTLAVSADANLGDASGGLAFTGGTLDMMTGFTTARDVTVVGTGTVEVDSGSGEIDGVISNGATAGALDKTGAGTLTLGGVNTYSGGTTIAAGTLAASSNANLGAASGGLTLTDSTLDMTTGFTTARDVTVVGTGTVEVDSGSGEIDGVISDGATTGALLKTGVGTLTLGGANTYSGGTNIGDGTLAVSADANLGDASGGLALTGGTLDMTTGFTTARDVTLVGTGTVEVDSGSGEIDGTITQYGNSELIKTGAGTLTLTGANFYFGGTTIAAGTLAVSETRNLGYAYGSLAFTGGKLDMTTGIVTAGDVTIAGTGTVEVDSGTGEFDGTIADGATTGALLKTGAATLTLTGANTYSGGTTIAAGALDLESAATVVDGVVTMGAAGTGAIKFSASSSSAPLAAPTTVLELGKAAQPESGGTFSNTLDDFGDAGEAIDLENYSGAATAVFVPDMFGSTNGTLTVSNGAVTEVFSLTNAKSTQFVARSYRGGTIVEALCFAAGTRIRVARGSTIVDAAVEDLLVGDIAVTASGALRLIRWLGHRTVAMTGGLPSEQRPVRIRAGAFGPAVPTRDLFLSPGHPVLVGSSPTEVLVPIMCLINGTTIDRVAADSVTWWHVELDAHDILLAENLPAESYLDWGDRAFFTEGADHALANPDFVAPGLAGRCRPVAIDGPMLEAERQRLDMVFALRLSSAAAWPDAHDTAFLV